jgi:type VI protein secretion system component Hcp
MMLRRFSAPRTTLFALAGALFCASLSFGQATPAKAVSGNTFRVAVDGLTCTAVAPGTFEALSFQIAVTDTIGNGGAGAGKIVLSDLLVQKAPDSCSVPLVVLAAGGKNVKRVVLTEVDKGNRPILTITLENVLIVAAQVNGSQSADAVEQLDFFYSTLTITDAAGNTTGSIGR